MSEVNDQATPAAPELPSSPAATSAPASETNHWDLRSSLHPAGLRALREQIVPQLVHALRRNNGARRGNGQAAAAMSADQIIENFSDLCCGHDDEAPFRYVTAELAAGRSAETVFLDLLAPTARRLGQRWEHDSADFTLVTLGVSRLQRVMRRVNEAFHDETVAETGPETIVLTIVPGEQHSFGLNMAAEFFRRAGWSICVGPFRTYRELMTLVQDRWFDVIGLSLSSDRGLDELRKQIRIMRSDSRNNRIIVILGGPFTVAHPEVVAAMGADLACDDPVAGPILARRLVRQIQAQV